MRKIQFMMDTAGHCFLCLKPANSSRRMTRKSKSRVEDNSPRIFSFRNICNYLKIDVMEVSSEAVPISYNSTYNILEQSELKGSLCVECTPLFEQFTNYFVELEGITMKLELSLKSIHDRMVQADSGHGKNLVEFQKEILRRQQTALRSGFVEQLRRKTISRCSVLIEKSQHPLISKKPTPAVSFVEVMERQSSANIPVVGEEVVETTEHLTFEEVYGSLDNTPIKRQCHLCPFTVDFDDDKSLQVHYNWEHGQPPDGKFRCDICDKTFSRNFNLIMHRQATHFGKKFICAFCSKSFNHVDLRRRHMQLHCPARNTRVTRQQRRGQVIPSENSIMVPRSTSAEVESSEETAPIINSVVGRSNSNDAESSNNSSIEMPLLTPMLPVEPTTETNSGQQFTSVGDIDANTEVSVKSKHQRKDETRSWFECDHCQKKFTLRFKRERHMKTCPKPRSREESPTDKQNMVQATRRSIRILGKIENSINKLKGNRESLSPKRKTAVTSVDDASGSGISAPNSSTSAVIDMPDNKTSPVDIEVNRRPTRRISSPSRYSPGDAGEAPNNIPVSSTVPVPPYEFCVCKTQIPGNMVRCENDDCQFGTWFHFDNDPPCVQFNNEEDWYCPMCQRAS